MKLYRTTTGIFVEKNENFFQIPNTNWDGLICSERLFEEVRLATCGPTVSDIGEILAPVMSQEVWAAGVTYYRSRDARMTESKLAGSGEFYDRVYTAARPELFFKATGRRVIGPGGAVQIRSDARWSIPEPELTLVVNPAGQIIGYTAGNDMSARDIEGENPLYLPQAKIYDGSCALGPCVVLASEELGSETEISLEIERCENVVFSGRTSLRELKRKPEQLVEYLFRHNSFPAGVYLMTGTAIVPHDDFSLNGGDRIRINIEGIGTLENYVL